MNTSEIKETMLVQVWEDGSLKLTDHLSGVQYEGKNCQMMMRVDVRKPSFPDYSKVAITNLNLDVNGDSVVSQAIS